MTVREPSPFARLRVESARDFVAHEYRTKSFLELVRRLPAMVRTNGLGQTLAHLTHRGDTVLIAGLRRHLITTGALPPDRANHRRPALIDELFELSGADWGWAEAESAAWLNWVKRLAEARSDAGQGAVPAGGAEPGGDEEE